MDVVLIRQHGWRQRDVELLKYLLEETAVIFLREGTCSDAHGGLTEVAVINGE